MHKIDSWKNPNEYANALKLKSKSTNALMHKKRTSVSKLKLIKK